MHRGPRGNGAGGLAWAARLVAAALALALAGCLGYGSSDAPAPVKLSGQATANTAAPSATQSAARPPSATTPPVAMLDIFRKVPFGKELSRADDVYAERSAQIALEYATDGASRPWTNPETGTTGTITPTRTYQEEDGTFCRAFDQSVQVRQRGNGDVKGAGDAKAQIACRQANGTWKFLP